MGFSRHVGLPESNYVYIYICVYIYMYIYIHSIYIYIYIHSIPGKIPAFLLLAFRQSGASQVRVATARDQHLWRPGFPVISGCDGSECGASTQFWGFSPSANGERGCRGSNISNGRDVCMSIMSQSENIEEYPFTMSDHSDRFYSD